MKTLTVILSAFFLAAIIIFAFTLANRISPKGYEAPPAEEPEEEVVTPTREVSQQDTEKEPDGILEEEIKEETPPGLAEETPQEIKKILFVSDLNGNDDIFSMNIDGTEITPLTDHPGSDLYPAASSDGKKIAYTSDIAGSWQIMVMNWDGTEKTQLTTNPERNGDPCWSNDGRYIFFEMYIEDNWELYRMDSDGNNLKRLTFRTGAHDWHPFCHPLQEKVLFESGLPGFYELYVMDYNGENDLKISQTKFEKRVPSMSADGLLIAFMGTFDNNRDIYTMDSHGENIKRLTESPGTDGHPNISPDIKYIVYQSAIDENDTEIFIMEIDGSNKRQITDLEGCYAIMPDFMYQP